MYCATNFYMLLHPLNRILHSALIGVVLMYVNCVSVYMLATLVLLNCNWITLFLFLLFICLFACASQNI